MACAQVPPGAPPAGSAAAAAAVVRVARRRGRACVSPPSSPPPAAGRTRLPLPLGPRVIACPKHGEPRREARSALPAASSTPRSVAPRPAPGQGRAAGTEGGQQAAWGVWMNETPSD